MTRSGELTQAYLSLPYGESQGWETYGGVDVNNKYFAGQPMDMYDSQLGDFGARYYKFGQFVFMTPDFGGSSPVPYATLDNPQSLNLYAYVGGNPIVRSDPSGHKGDKWTVNHEFDLSCDYGDDNECPPLTKNATNGPPPTIRTETTITVHAGRHWWDKLGSWFSSHAASVGIAFGRFGRLGGPAHRGAVNRIARSLKDEGYKVTEEKYIRTPQGSKPYRFADVYGENESTGEVQMYQVGRTKADGTPVTREVQAMDDIEGSTGIRPQFIDYNNPAATGDMPVAPITDAPEVAPDIPTPPE